MAVFYNNGELRLKKSRTSPGTAGTLNLGRDLLPGRYHVVYQTEADSTVGDTLNFTVNRPAVAAGQIRLGVINDVHVMAPSLIVNDGTAFQNYLAEDRKMLREAPEVAKALCKTFLANRPDVLLVPGDLTKDGERASHELFVSIFQPLVDAGTKIIVVPGNHDINNPGSVSFNGATTTDAPTVSAAEFAEIYRNFGFGQALSRDTASLSYVTEPVSGLRVFALDVCQYYNNQLKRNGYSINLNTTEGLLKTSTIEWMKAQAALARKAGKRMIALMHHNTVAHFNGEWVVANPYLLSNYSEAQTALMEAGIKVVFTGHFHSTDIKCVTNGVDSLYEVETGSTVTYPCPYRLLTLDKAQTQLSVDTRFVDSVAWPTAPLTFQQYAKSKLTAGIPALLAGWFSGTYYDALQAAIPSQYQSYVRFPSRQDFGTLCSSLMAEPVTQMLLTMNEGNENLKQGSLLVSRINAAMDSVARSLAESPEHANLLVAALRTLDYYKLMQDGMQSILGNTMVTPSTQTDRAANSYYVVRDVSGDDLFPTLSLLRSEEVGLSPIVSTPASLTAKSIGHRIVVTLTAPSPSDVITLFDGQGRPIATRHAAAIVEFTPPIPGIYFVRYQAQTCKVNMIGD